jgi:hypothetical protein
VEAEAADAAVGGDEAVEARFSSALGRATFTPKSDRSRSLRRALECFRDSAAGWLGDDDDDDDDDDEEEEEEEDDDDDDDGDDGGGESMWASNARKLRARWVSAVRLQAPANSSRTLQT